MSANISRIEPQSYVLVSVVVPSYNRAHLICDALDSICLQTHRPIEVVVVDDGSEDDTEAVVADWTKAHTNSEFTLLYLSQPNLGGNAARNTGIKSAKGEFIGFLDSDDCWHETKLEKQLASMAMSVKNGAVYCGVQHIDFLTGKQLEPTKRHYPEGELLEQLIVKDVTAPTSTYLVKKEVFDNVGLFDESLAARQDWDMWIRISTCYEIGVVAQPLVDFREHQGPRTSSDPQREIKAYARIMQKYAHVREAQSFSVRQAAKASYYRRMGRVCLHHQSLKLKSLTYYIKALATWPFDFDNIAAILGWFLPKKLRRSVHRTWNRWLGKSIFSIRSH